MVSMNPPPFVIPPIVPITFLFLFAVIQGIDSMGVFCEKHKNCKRYMILNCMTWVNDRL